MSAENPDPVTGGDGVPPTQGPSLVPEPPDDLVELLENEGWDLISEERSCEAGFEINGVPQDWVVTGVSEEGGSTYLTWDLVPSGFFEQATPFCSASFWMSASMTGGIDGVEAREFNGTMLVKLDLDEILSEVEIRRMDGPVVDLVDRVIGSLVSASLEGSLCPGCEEVGTSGWRIELSVPDELDTSDINRILDFCSPCPECEDAETPNEAHIDVNGESWVLGSEGWRPALEAS